MKSILIKHIKETVDLMEKEMEANKEVKQDD